MFVWVAMLRCLLTTSGQDFVLLYTVTVHTSGPHSVYICAVFLEVYVNSEHWLRARWELRVRELGVRVGLVVCM